MKRLLYKLLTVIVYISILMYFTGFHIVRLISIEEMLLVITGAILLSIVHYKRNYGWKEMINIIGKNALAASYIETFVLLFVRLNALKGYQDLLSDIALNCRPILYGYMLSLLLQKEESKDIGVEAKQDENKLQVEITALDIFCRLKELGLTTREAEIARLIMNNYSNHAIAEELCISETTVKKHVSHIFEKLSLSKREQLKTIL